MKSEFRKVRRNRLQHAKPRRGSTLLIVLALLSLLAFIGMVFYTDVTRRDAEVHALNRVLRKFKIPTTPPGRSRLKDRVKAPVGKAIVELRRRANGETRDIPRDHAIEEIVEAVADERR